MTETSTTSPDSKEALVDRKFGINNKYGLMLVGHDAIEMDVTEYVVASTLDRLKDKSPSVELADAIVLSTITEEQIRKIYPDLDRNFLGAFTKVFGENESVLVIFEQTDSEDTQYDFISEINKAKGKIKRHKPQGEGTGWGDSIRGAIPLPSDRTRYEEVDRKIDSGELSPEDYIKLTHHLVHGADNEEELAGLYMLIDEKRKKEIFGREAKKFDKWAQENVGK